MSSLPRERLHLIYPDSDGEPMAENTLQFEWIVLIKLGLEACFVNDPDVFVAGDLFWYPLEGRPDVRLAPDVMVALGRPKGHRRSYLQWLEANISPQVVFEILSPGNRPGEMARKLNFYQQYGVLEYYIYDPDENILEGFQRQGRELVVIPETSIRDWVSPLLGVRFELSPTTLRLYQPSGKPFLSYLELLKVGEEAIEKLRENRRLLSLTKAQLETAEQRAETAEQRAETAEQRAETAEQRAVRLAEQLRRLGFDPDET
jgi:Uma2 family endonuclease